ncbi:hypothetical protein JHW43_005748 [Diplocarpon mali]|nr:hypothetical protein JHW43_005748 [Diplocarpon mali]
MKATTLLLGVVASVSANIIFNHVPLGCNSTDVRMYHGCLRGQDCTETGQCVAVDAAPYSNTFRPGEIRARDGPYSTDGSCGPAHGNTICDPNSKAYVGGCCSVVPSEFRRRRGEIWADLEVTAVLVVFLVAASLQLLRLSQTLPLEAMDNVVLNTEVRPVIQWVHMVVAAHNTGLPKWLCQALIQFVNIPQGIYFQVSTQIFQHIASQVSIDIQPATHQANNFLLNIKANCIRNLPEKFCGTTDGHCLVANGCQNGCKNDDAASATTSGEPVIDPVKTSMAPESTATARVTTDGTCGSSNGNTICAGSDYGNCCSMYGFCGSTSAHCGAGCQSGKCLNAPAVAVPGPSSAPAAPNGGSFRVVGQAGVPAMHAALMPNGRVFFLDKLENYTQLRTANGYYAMSAEYDPVTNQAVPLAYATNAFCSGGTFLADGRVISVGGNAPLTWLDPNIGDGFSAIRYLERSSTDASLNGQSWSEPGNKLASARWYASAQTMPDGTIFVASGSLNGLDPTVLANNNPTYEVLSAAAVTGGANIPMDILKKNQPYYMYPFVHLLNDGTLFVFVSKSSQIFNVGSNTVVKELPDLPGDYRTYPNTGGSVLLPLSSKNNWAPDIIICGGGAYQDITSPTDASCGRIQPLDAGANWELDSMPEGRGMVEGTLLPDGTVVWMNGGSRGAQGFGLMESPALEALLYDPTKPLGQRFSTLASSTIPRLYHSVCLLLLDGTMMVAGSNPVEMPQNQADAKNPYVTEWRVENYVPPYLQGDKANQRPTSLVLGSKTVHADGSQFTFSFIYPHESSNVKVVLYHGGFVTHSLHMGHRMLNLDVVNRSPVGTDLRQVTVNGPPNRNVAPPGPYVMYVLVDGVPSVGHFVQVV